MTKIDIYLGEKLRQRRKKLNLSQDSFGKMLNISSQQVHKYESGLNRISASMLLNCAKLLHVPITYFYDGIPLNDNITDIAPDTNLRCEGTSPLAILLVDDNPVDEILIRDSIAKTSKKTILHTVHDGVEVLQFLRSKRNTIPFPKPDIILLDLNIPKRSGFEILKDIKRDRDLMIIPVIVLTNSINPDDMLKSYKNGASGFMSKSFDIIEFNKNISLLIDYWHDAIILPSMQGSKIDYLMPLAQEA